MASPVKASRWLNLFETVAKDVRIQSKEIITDDPRGAPLVLWESQRRFLCEVGNGLDKGIHKHNCLKSRQLGVCLHPDTKVLTADLTWARIEDLRPGTEIVSVDEYPPGGVGKHRKMRVAVVEAAVKVFRKRIESRLKTVELLSAQASIRGFAGGTAARMPIGFVSNRHRTRAQKHLSA